MTFITVAKCPSFLKWEWEWGQHAPLEVSFMPARAPEPRPTLIVSLGVIMDDCGNSQRSGRYMQLGTQTLVGRTGDARRQV